MPPSYPKPIALYDSVNISTMADSNGRFVLGGIRFGQAYIITVHAAGYVSVSRSVVASKDAQYFDLVNCRTVKGTVRNHLGTPIAGVVVGVQDISAITGMDGRFEVRGITTAACQLEAHGENVYPTQKLLSAGVKQADLVMTLNLLFLVLRSV
jgi:hypothetical protein